MERRIVQTEAELRSVIKSPPPTVTGKIASGPLRSSPSDFLAMCRLAFVTTVDDAGQPHVFAAGGDEAFVSQAADGTLLVPVPEEHRTAVAARLAGQPFAGLLGVIPGVRHTFRVNGSAGLHDDGTLALTPAESYAHCAKAFIRSKLWTAHSAADQPDAEADPAADPQLNDDSIAFIAASPFAALGTSLVDAEADVSPRGDPPGFVTVVDSQTLFVPDRPGNRIADSLRNIVANPAASLLFLVPGDSRSLHVAGAAHVTTDDALRNAATVNGKTPKLGVVLDVQSVQLRPTPALAAAGAWDAATHAAEADLPTLGALVADPNGTGSRAKRLIAGTTDRLVDVDYRRNLY